MKRLVLPTKQKDFVPTGIYALDISERKQAFKKSFDKIDNESPSIGERRQRVYKELRGGLFW